MGKKRTLKLAANAKVLNAVCVSGLAKVKLHLSNLLCECVACVSARFYLFLKLLRGDFYFVNNFMRIYFGSTKMVTTIATKIDTKHETKQENNKTAFQYREPRFNRF